MAVLFLSNLLSLLTCISREVLAGLWVVVDSFNVLRSYWTTVEW
jgi:hypothetical protein